MSNEEYRLMGISPITSGIPPLHEEKPIKSFRGFVFSNEAWHCRHDDLWPPKKGEALPDDWIRAACDLYLGNFCRPIKSIANEVRCVACNEDLTMPYGQGAKVGMMQTHLKIDKQTQFWEARCGNCGYPVRCKHTIVPLPPRPPVPVLVRLDFFPLCYHPSATERAGAFQ